MDTPINPEFGEGRWQDALRRMRDRIINGLELIAWDDTTPCNKSTHCSWGLCSQDVDQWPDADDHTWPDAFENHNRVAPRDARGGCPLDKNTGTPKENRSGCFYRCRVFQGKIIEDSQDEVIQLYNKVIDNRERTHGRLTTADDDEPWRT